MQTNTKRLYINRTPTSLQVCGSDTYNLRDTLRQWGGKWNSVTKCWVFPYTAEAQLLILINTYHQPTIPPIVVQPITAPVVVPTITRPIIPNLVTVPTIPQPIVTVPTIPQPTILQPTIPRPVVMPRPTILQPIIPRPVVITQPTILQPTIPRPVVMPQPTILQPVVMPQPTMPNPVVIPQPTIPRPIVMPPVLIQAQHGIEVITTPPPKNIRGLFAYNYQGQILVCGNKTFNVMERLRTLNGRFNKELSCWVLSRQHEADVLQLINELKLEKVANKQRTNQLRKEEQEQKAEEERQRLNRLQQHEREEEFIPNIDRLPQNVINEAHLNDTIDELMYEMEALDLQELRQHWSDIIQIVQYPTRKEPHTTIVTYDGDIKPTDDALMGAANGWQVPPLYTVNRIDYKLYRVWISGTD